ncbi:MAG: DUF4178 domain-containing protein [Bacteroidetes bacterium]|nr:MAG: DUF4178 domain-containing protein [Bacteroidota bacterium]
MAFSLFRKRDSEKRNTVLSALDLQPGSTFNYHSKSWKVAESYRYDWGDDDFSFDHKVVCGEESFALSVEEYDWIRMVKTSPIVNEDLHRQFVEAYAADSALPKRFDHNGCTFELVETAPGYVSEWDSDEAEELINYDYEDIANRSHVFSVEQYDEDEFEMFEGHKLETIEITRISQ